MEATWGSSHRPIKNYAQNPEALDRTALGLDAFPMLYPSAVQRNYVPSFTYGGRVGTFSPTNTTQYAPFENWNTTHDVNVSVTRLMGRHTAKVGAFWNYALKSQSSRAPANGLVSFQNDASNPFDTGYPFANAALGIYQSYTQAADWVTGNYVYNNYEWYVQDNWRVNDRLTLDYGLRFYWLEPTYDTKLQTSNFLPDQFNLGAAPRLYYPAVDPRTNTKVALDRATGAMVPAVNIGRLVPGSGSLVGNGLYQAGAGIDEHLYQNRGIHYAPRFGFAYDVTGVQRVVVRGAGGVFFDRAAGDTVYAMIEQPPTVAAPNLFYGRLQDIAGSSGTLAPPTVAAFDYEAKIPTVYAFNAGIQMQLPWTSAARRVVRWVEEPESEHTGEHQCAGVWRGLSAGKSGSHCWRVSRPQTVVQPSATCQVRTLCRSTFCGRIAASATSFRYSRARTPTTTRCRHPGIADSPRGSRSA